MLDERIYEIFRNETIPRSIEDADYLQSYFSNLTFFSKLMDSFGAGNRDFVVSSVCARIDKQVDDYYALLLFLLLHVGL